MTPERPTLRRVLVRAWLPIAAQLADIGRRNEVLVALHRGEDVVLPAAAVRVVADYQDAQSSTGYLRLSGEDTLTEADPPS